MTESQDTAQPIIPEPEIGDLESTATEKGSIPAMQTHSPGMDGTLMGGILS